MKNFSSFVNQNVTFSLMVNLERDEVREGGNIGGARRGYKKG